MSNVIEVNVDNFKSEIEESSMPVAVKFYTNTCMPCRMIAPTFEQASVDYDGKIKFAAINIDGNRKLFSEFSVNVVPTIIFVKDNDVISSLVGAINKERIDVEILKILQESDNI